MSSARLDGRALDSLRPVVIEPNPLQFAEGSALVAFGNTRVLCAATIEEKVPPWLRNQGRGWITAEYSMLPREIFLPRKPRSYAPATACSMMFSR